MESIIRTDNLNFSYGKNLNVVSNLNIDVPLNSIYGFLGPNGAGKSTTIKLLLGLLKSEKDNVYLFGKEFKSNKHEILRNVGSLIEAPTIYSNLTASENLLYLNKIYKKKSDRIENVLKVIGLWKQRDKRVKKFSTGMKQRLGIGMAIFHDPELIILDEPVNGLDPQGVYEIRALLLKLQNAGKTIFISSHLLSEIEKVCSHVGIINKGKLLYQGNISSLISNTSKNVQIQTTNNIEACKLLQSNNFYVKNIVEDVIEVKIDSAEEFNEVIYSLVANKYKINNIETKSTNLEDIFIDLTSK